MAVMRVAGGQVLRGCLEIGGSKNGALALLPVALLAPGTYTFDGVPDVTDIHILLDLFRRLEVKAQLASGTVQLDTTQLVNKPLPDGKVSRIRASIYLAGVLLARFGEVTIGLPGGCPLSRKVDFHMAAFEKMGAQVQCEGEILRAFCPSGRLQGTVLELDPRWRSVGTTVNILLAASLAEGTTIIRNAAMDPEVVACAQHLKAMGARITGEGTTTVAIEGVRNLRPIDGRVIPDRLVAGSYLAMAAATNGSITVTGVPPDWLSPFLSKLQEAGVRLKVGSYDITVEEGKGRPKPVALMTEPFPGFPTDLQPLMSAVLSRCDGISLIVETIHRDRLLYAEELNKMGARILTETAANPNGLPSIAWISGVPALRGAVVEATDLRAGAALLTAALAAEGETWIRNGEKILRGYEKIVDALKSLGANLEMTEEDQVVYGVAAGAQTGD
ncbi:MAG: UDP-N-acetylglucosamine 1-carboxyvinyltransferase [Armatimonadetes bacterium]|nr:UDP-N-acetylglucosamine 1-carboxyvinyltransferase [Armatimonadota bacterium]